MDVREFPVLTDDEGDLVDRLAAGLGENAARVLAYLLGRFEDPSLDRTSTLMAIHIGTGLARSAAREGVTELEEAGLIEGTTAETTTPGRPPKAWHAVDSTEATTRRAYERHARGLLRQGERFDGRAATGPDSRMDSDSRAGSDSRVDSNANRSERVPDADRPLSIGLNWHANGLHLPLFAARHDEETNDLAFAIEEYDGSSAAARAVAAGEVDVGVAGSATVLRERTRGRPIVPIAVLYQRSAVVVYTTRDAFGGSFDAIEQLRDRRLGMPPGAETELLARVVLEQAGIGEAVEIVDIEGEERAALESNEVDAITGMFPDLWRMDRSTQAVDVLAVADHYPVYGPALIANREAIRRDRSRLEAALAAATAGWAAASHAPEPAVAEIATRSNRSPPGIERTFSRASERLGTTDAVRNHGWGWHSAETWERLRTALAQGGVLE